MKKLIIFTVIVILGKPMFSHPSWGIAIAKNGDIYFADVLHGKTGTVWKLDQQGNVSKVLTDFHAHDLQLDAEGNLWVADDRWIQGEVEGEGEQTLLKISPEGNKETIIFTKDRDDFHGGGFALGPDESVYFALHKKIWKRPFSGETSLLINHEFERIVTLYTDDEFNLWITDKGHKHGTLFKWSEEDGLKEIAAGLLPQNPENPIFEEDRFHLLYGIIKGEDNAIYVTENADRKILRIDESGKISDYYTSEINWYPGGIAFYQGYAYIMELGYKNEHLGPKIIKLDKSKIKTTLFDYQEYKKRQ